MKEKNQKILGTIKNVICSIFILAISFAMGASVQFIVTEVLRFPMLIGLFLFGVTIVATAMFNFHLFEAEGVFYIAEEEEDEEWPI